MSSPEPRPSRYERIKALLNTAAGEAHPSYQGRDRFWNLPLPDLLSTTLYGIPIIAPPVAVAGPAASGAAGTCCHEEAGSGAPPQHQPGRGAQSGLVKGLRGQFPFDGTQFPPLPWGGTRVAEADIQLIEQWIDDGCPADDASRTTVEVAHAHAVARALGHEEHPLHAGPVNQFYGDAGRLKVRKNVEYLTPDELQRLRRAIAQMKSLDAYWQDERSFGFWARIHANLCQHGWEEFLTWHRAYLYFFEQQLQDIDQTVTLPYWDWPLYRPDVEISIEDMGSSQPRDNGIIPGAYRCWIDDEGLGNLAAGGVVPAEVVETLRTILGQTFNSGSRLFKAAGIPYGQNAPSDAAIIAELGRINPLWHRYRWPGGNKDIIFEAYPTPDDIERILQLDNFFDFGSGPENNHVFGALENVHNLIHNFSGGDNPSYDNSTDPMNRAEPKNGDMVNAGVTAYDPIFWAHHSNVDRLWAEWQKRHPDTPPDDPTAVLPPWNLTVQQTFSVANLGYDYALSAHVFPTDSTVPIQRFRSAPALVHTRVLAAHRRAEVRLHSVQQVTRAGYHVRVFLNTPAADIETPTRGNARYVGQLNTFTGSCIGGPGHCDVPRAHRRAFDHRPRPHKLPGDFHLDATAAVQALAAQGEKDVTVHLVVLNTDGTPATDALRLDAVSLIFKD